MARVSNHLEQLVREAEVLASIKNDVPNAWKILEMEIGRARAAVVRAADADLALSASPPDPPAALHDHAPRHSVRKRVKLRVPADQYPEYNFVGRLLGPRGATLKRLERDTGCRIMIRGKGSIRKDKEPDVRGKPGWEHVFNEPLHVVIEVVDSPDDLSATRILAHAKKLVEILLIPVPEERDSLKRAQLRDLAILNGTHRSVSDLLGATPHNVPLPAVHRSNPLAASPPPLRRAQSQHSKPSQKMYANDYANMFEPLLPFARHNSFSSPPPPPSQRPLHNLAPYAHSNAFASTSHDSLLSELEKLRLPALDFDHLTEPNLAHNNYNNNNNNNNINNHRHHHNSNILNNNNDSNNIPNNKNKHNNNNNNNNTNIANIANNNTPNNINSNNNANNINNNLNSNSNLPVPAPSPTIVDPEIYPYPPTPGVLSADQQLSAFASPMWTPSRAAASTMSSSSLPPRSPPAAADNNNQPTSSFLLGRTLGDFSRHTQAHGAHDLAPMDGVSFDQCFAPHHAPQFGDVDGRDCVSAHKHPFSAMRNSNGDAIVLANLFHTAPTTGSSCKPFDQRRALSSSSSSSSCHVERGESLNVSKQQQAVHQCSAPVRAQQQSAGAQTGGAHGQAGRSSPQPSGGGGGGGSQGERKAPQDC